MDVQTVNSMMPVDVATLVSNGTTVPVEATNGISNGEME
jgi:hypothetical protein